MHIMMIWISSET